MVFSLLSLFTPMIRKLTCSPNLLTTNILNSFVKTLVSSPWIDLLLFSFFLMQFASSFFFFYFALFNMFLFDYFSVLLCLVFHIIFFFGKLEKYKNSLCFVYIGTCVPWMAIETKFSKLCISCNLDEHLYAQLSKWALWLLFVMSKIKWSLVLNNRTTLFYWKD